jgi:outer membrane protein assembly factor BamB
MKRAAVVLSLLALAAVFAVPVRHARSRGVARAAEPERALFGSYPTRNMVSEETALPTKWDVKTGTNVKWSQATGSQTYAGPVVADGKVFLGTNNEGERNPKIKGDKGVVMAFKADTGEFLWQMVTDKLSTGRVNDWPQQGVCSTPFVEGKRLYYTSNQAHIVCLDTEGLKDGKNDGVQTEKYKDDTDGDVIWEFDLMGELDVFPHNLAASSPIVVGDMVYVTTANGVDESHVNIPSPKAPSFVALDKNTGKLVWESNLPGENIIHGNWSNASFGVVKGKPQVVFGGGDGWVYSFEPKTGELLWKFNANPKGSVYALGARGTKNDIIASPVIFEDKVFIGVGQDPEHGEGVGNLWAFDASGTGDITDKSVVWHRGGEDFRRTISTVAIKDGIVYASNLSGFVYALDLQTGKPYWEHDMFAAVWGSPFVADGKVYLGDEDGDVTVFKAGKTKEVLAEMNMGNAVYTTPYAKDGVLYVLSRNRLFAIKDGAKSEPLKKGD